MRYTISLVLLAAATGFSQEKRSLPAFFIPNFGQTDASVRFVVDTPELRAGFTANSAIFQLDRLTLRVRFAGANAQAAIEGVKRLTAQANFLIGNRPNDWLTNLPVYEKILYRDLYPGIDMSYSGSGHSIKSEFLVSPGADPNQIRLDYSGATLSIAPDGDLLIRGGNIEAMEAAPFMYQESGATAADARVEIPGRYLLLDAHTVGFEIAAYDRSRPLIIDPVLSYATYLGGSGNGAVSGVAVDSSGDLYVTGWTESLNFPIAGPIQASNGGDVDAFVAKLSPAGSGLVYATYIGGNGDDQGAAIAVDSTGEAYVTGSTGSSNFPSVAAFQPTLAGGRDAFALKINALGSLLVYSTYLGGVNTDTGNAIAVDSSDNAYIAGDTQSANFPILSAEQPVFGGNQNAFVTKLTSAGAKVFSTFLGGWGVDHAGGIALDSTNNIYITGGTSSTNFPVLGAIQAVNGGGQDAFLTKINAAGSAIAYSTYLGGTGGSAENPEEANAVAVDSSGNAYIAGTTNSVNFPVTAGAFQASLNAVQDAFAAKVNPAGNALVYSSYLGGSAFNWANGIAVTSSGIAYVAGYTSSFDFPVVVPVQASFGGLYDAFISVFNATGSSLIFSTFYGGSGSDEANAIAVDASGNMYFGGQTNSTNLTLLNPIQATNAGFALGWLAQMGVTSGPPQLTASSVSGTTPQSAAINTAFGSALAVTLESAGNPVSGVNVVFTAPSSGVGGLFGNSTATISVATNALGVASAPFTANGTAGGPYAVTAAATNYPVVSFSLTNTAGPGLSAPTLISPANGAMEVSLAAALNWNAAAGATSYDVYFGTSSFPPFVTNTTATTYGPGTLAATTTYYWYIVARNGSGTAPSVTWSFTTQAPAPALQFYPVAPCRLVDTRGASTGFNGIAPFSGPSIPGQGTITIPVQSAAEASANTMPAPCGAIPSTAQAYSFNVTVVPAAGGAVNYVSLWPAGSTQSVVSTLDDTQGLIVSNAAIVPAGSPSGGISVYNDGPSTTDVIIDMNGYFAPPGAGLEFYPVAPCRLVDTRGEAGGFNGISPFSGPPIPPAGTATIPVQSATEASTVTEPTPCGVIPSGAEAYSFNLTLVPTVAGSRVNYVSLWPSGSKQPVVSTLDDPQGLIVSNAAIVPAGTPSGGVSVYNDGPSTTDVVIDMNGYFAAPAGLQFYPVTPCRLVDTRGAAAGFNGIEPFSGPSIPGGGTLTIPVQSATEASTDTEPAPCGVIPSVAQAYSINLTVVPAGATGTTRGAGSIMSHFGRPARHSLASRPWTIRRV